MRNSIPNITKAEVITAFIRGLHHRELRSKFNHKPPTGIGEMIITANQYADAEEAEVHFNEDAGTQRLPNRYDDRPDNRRHSDRRPDDHSYHRNSGCDRTGGHRPGQNHRRRLEHIIAAVSQPRAKRNYDEQYQKILDSMCPLHKNAKHKMKDCIGLAREFQDKRLDDDANDGAGGRRPPRNNNNAF
jgi:hypothetical protein